MTFFFPQKVGHKKDKVKKKEKKIKLSDYLFNMWKQRTSFIMS